MAETASTNDQNQPDPIHLAALLTCVAIVIGRLTPDQTEAVTAVFGLSTTIVPFLPQGRR